MKAERFAGGCASFRVEWGPRSNLVLVMTIPSPNRREIRQVEQLVEKVNAVRGGEAAK